MKKRILLPALVASFALLGACSSVPKTTNLLDQTRSEFQAAQSNPSVVNFAPLELKQASDALDQANAAAKDQQSPEQIDRLAYLAKQKIALSQEVALKKAAQTDVANSGQKRDQILLAQRTQEANQSKQVALGSQAYAAQLEAELAGLSAKRTARGMVITLNDMLFATDRTRLSPEGTQTVQKLADIMKNNPSLTVQVEGYTDSTGSNAHNQKLSENRANTVRSALLSMDIASERVAMHGYGEAYPVVSNRTAHNRQLNRRVEIILSDENGHVIQR